jgi:hypothetical protein
MRIKFAYAKQIIMHAQNYTLRDVFNGLHLIKFSTRILTAIQDQQNLRSLTHNCY